MSIYPNPTHDYLHIKLRDTQPKAYSIELLDITGRQVLYIPYKEVVGGLMTLDLRGIQAGAYLLSVHADTLSEYQRIIVQ